MMFDEQKVMTWDPDEPIPVLNQVTIPAETFRDGIIVRGSNWLGDAVMTFPALKQLRSILPPYCGLCVVTPAGLAPVYHALKGVVDRVIPLSNAHAFPTKDEKYELHTFHAGAGVIFNNSFRDALIFKLAGVKRLYGAKARNRSILLAASWKFEKRRDHELNHPHQALKYLAMAQALGAAPWDGEMPEMTPGACSDEITALMKNPDVLAIAPGAAYGDGKRWRAAHFRAVAEKWLEKYPDGRVLALGSRAEFDGAGEAIEGLDPARAINLAGKTSLDELMYILKYARFCIANDSGIMHLSAALGSSGIAVFGSTDPAATAPVSQKWYMLYDKLPCSPCFKRVCPLGTKACLDRITPADVIALMEKLSVI